MSRVAFNSNNWVGQMKKCYKCKVIKDKGGFYKRSLSKDGLTDLCKQCSKLNAAFYYQKNKEKMRAQAKDWKINNPEKIAAYQKKYRGENKEYYLESFRKWQRSHKKESIERAIEWQKKNPEKVKQSAKLWRKNNRHVGVEATAARRAACKRATPKWANKFFMLEIYHLARIRTRSTGIKWHVDHVIPLNGKLVCGLHVETNMNVIPWLENVKKSNKFKIL